MGWLILKRRSLYGLDSEKIKDLIRKGADPNVSSSNNTSSGTILSYGPTYFSSGLNVRVGEEKTIVIASALARAINQGDDDLVAFIRAAKKNKATNKDEITTVVIKRIAPGTWEATQTTKKVQQKEDGLPSLSAPSIFEYKKTGRDYWNMVSYGNHFTKSLADELEKEGPDLEVIEKQIEQGALLDQAYVPGEGNISLGDILYLYLPTLRVNGSYKQPLDLADPGSVSYTQYSFFTRAIEKDRHDIADAIYAKQNEQLTKNDKKTVLEIQKTSQEVNGKLSSRWTATFTTYKPEKFSLLPVDGEVPDENNVPSRWNFVQEEEIYYERSDNPLKWVQVSKPVLS